MGGKKTSKRNKPAAVPQDSNIVAAMLSGVDELYRAHAGEIAKVREESADQSVVVSFSVDIDCSESAPKVKTKMSFTQRVTDSRTALLDDPNQGSFTTMTAEAEKESKEAKARERHR